MGPLVRASKLATNFQPIAQPKEPTCAYRTWMILREQLYSRIGRNAFGGLYDFSGRGHEIIQTSTGDDYRVAPAMRLFRDPHEAATLVLSEFYEEMLTLNL
jgi:hypothetical protein